MILMIRWPRIASICMSTAASLAVTVALAADADVKTSPGDGETIQVAAEETVADGKTDLPQLVNDAISITSRRYLTADVHTPWQIMHGLLALRSEYLIKVDGEKVSALNWLTERRLYKGTPIIEHTPHGGRFHTFTEPYAFEGHPNQFLAIATMSELPVDFAFNTTVGGQVTIQDMINNAKADVNDREEITWTLWALSRYLPVDSEWFSTSGEPWSIERLVQIQTYADPNEAACGGTHGLFALALARNSYLATGKPLRGIWLEADQKIKSYIAKSKALQNPDGTFSTEYFKGPGQSTDFGKRIATSGHILEYLMVAARDDELQQDWLQNAIHAVANDLVENRRAAADCGPLYHALHALVLYRQRAGFKPAEASLAIGSPKQTEPKKLLDPAIASGDVKPTTPNDKTATSTPSTPSDAKPEISKADPAKPARLEPGTARKIDEASQPARTERLTKVETDPNVRPLSNTEPQSEKTEQKADKPSVFDSEVAKPILAEEATVDNKDEPAANQELSEKLDPEDSVKVSYRQPEDNAYKGSDGGPGSENVSEVPLPPTDD